MVDSDNLPKFFEESNDFCDAPTTNFSGAAAADDIFSILEALENASGYNNNNNNTNNQAARQDSNHDTFEFHKSSLVRAFQLDSDDAEAAASPKSKRQKLLINAASASASASASQYSEQGLLLQPRTTHITVERNRRKQMNEHLAVLRSLMPCFYVKRGDQASIIGGVINYINELQQVLQSLESKRQRKSYTDILSPRKPPLSPRMGPPISPRTPQSSSPYKPMMQNVNMQLINSPSSLSSPVEIISPCNSSTNSSINDCINELVASSKSAAAEVEVKFCGPNLLLKTVSLKIPGQVVKIVSALEQLALEILQVNINKVDERMLNSFTIKIGIECQLSAEELAQQIQQTFC